MKTLTRFSFPAAARYTPTVDLVTSVLKVFQVARERRALSRLDQRALSDIGISREDAAIESGRMLWDLPAGR